MKLFKGTSIDDFWDQLIEDSDNLTKEAFYPNRLSTKFKWESIFKTFFESYHKEGKVRETAKVRLYVDSEKNSSLIERISNTPPGPNQSIENWGETLFETQPWCIILDKVSGFMDELTTEVASWLAPYVSTLQDGSFSTGMSPYIGRYGYTPFGAHLDIDGVSILHLHMGPGTKEMTIWPKDEF
jgi:hypothetical protein